MTFESAKKRLLQIMVKDLRAGLTDSAKVLLEIKILKKAKNKAELEALINKYQDRFYDLEEYEYEKKVDSHTKIERLAAMFVAKIMQWTTDNDWLVQFLTDCTKFDGKVEELYEKYPEFKKFVNLSQKSKVKSASQKSKDSVGNK